MAKQKRNPELLIRFYHADLDILSNRTLNTLFREFSKICHETMLEEIDLFLDETNIPYRVKQSVKDRLKKIISQETKFYVESISKGSLECTVILSAVGLWFLKSTLGESFKKAYANSDAGKKIENIMLNTLNRLTAYIKKRPDSITQNILPYFKGRVLADRFIIREIKSHRAKYKNDITAFIKIETLEEVDLIRSDNVYNNDETIEYVKEEIKKLKKDGF